MSGGSWWIRRRAALAKAVRDRIAGPQFQAVHDRIWNSPGPRWFSEADAIWRVHADTSMFIGGIRALLLQSLHPVAMLGVSEHSGFRSDPWGRLQRTSRFLATTTYGNEADAERSIAIVRAVHGRVTRDHARRRALPGRRSTSAGLDPRGRGRQLPDQLPDLRRGADSTATEADDYVRQSGWVAEKLGVLDPPQTVAELDACLKRFRPELEISPAAREAADLLLRDPPLTGPARLGYRLLAAGACSILPGWARAELALPDPLGTGRLVARPIARSGLSVIRWGLAGGDAV